MSKDMLDAAGLSPNMAKAFSKRRTPYDRKGKAEKLTREELETAYRKTLKWKVLGKPFQINQWGTLVAFPQAPEAEKLLPMLTPFVKVLDARVFRGNEYLCELRLPEGLERIPPECFRSCGNLKTVEIPNTVKEIMEGAFADCDALERITLPEKLEVIPPYCFVNCTSLKTVMLPDTVKEIGEGAFGGCSALEEIMLPEGLEVIPPRCFMACENLKTLSLPGTVQDIYYAAFGGCSALEEIVLPEGLEIVAHSCFADCDNLKRIVLPGTLKTIGKSAFENCRALEEIKLPEKLRSIPADCFSACSQLKTVGLPDALEFVGKGAFQFCFDLETLHFGDRLWGAVMPWGEAFLPDEPRIVIPDTASFYTQKDRLDAYGGDDFDSIFPNAETFAPARRFSFLSEAPLPPRSPEDGAMRFRSSIRSAPAFDYSGDLEEYYLRLSGMVDMPIIPRSADYAAFRDGFTDLKAASGLNAAFGLPAFNGAILSEGITEVPGGAFADLQGFRAIRLPSTLKWIRAGAFENCRDLEFINLFSGIEIENGAFDGCEHIAWVYDDELRGGNCEPTAAELRALFETLDAVFRRRGILCNSPELRYLKALLPRIVIDGGDGALQDVAELQKKMIAKLDRKREIKAPLSGERGKLVAVCDARLREAAYLAARYEQRYLCK